MDRVQAIVLATAPYSETTLLVRLLTRERGAVRGLAKGARRPRANQATYDLFAWIEVGMGGHPGGDRLVTLIAPALREGWDYLRRDITRQAWAALGLEVLGAVAAEAPAETVYFDEACRFLTALEEAAGPGSLCVALLLRLLHQTGHPPRLDADPPPAAPLAPWTWDFQGQELRPARADDDLTRPGLMRLPGSVVAALRGALLSPPDLEHPPPLSGPAGPAALRWLVRIWQDQLSIPLRSMGYLEEMVLKGR